MNAEFRAMLSSAAVHDDIIKYLSDEGCVDIGLFANWVDAGAGIKTLVNATNQRDKAVEVAKLKQCWKKAVAANDRNIKRAAEGLPEESLDEPLPVPQHQDVLKAWQGFYKWPRVDSRRVCMDTQFCMFRREFLSFQPSMFSISRVKTLAQAQKSPTEKAKTSRTR